MTPNGFLSDCGIITLLLRPKAESAGGHLGCITCSTGLRLLNGQREYC
jgi:hypothetical protein